MSVPSERLRRHQAELEQIQQVLDHLVHDAGAKLVFLVDKNGQLIAASGVDDALCSGSKGPPADRFDGRDSFGVHKDIRVVAGRVILVTMLASNSRPALPYDCMGRASDALHSIVVELDKKAQQAGCEPFFPEVTPEDIDNLLAD